MTQPLFLHEQLRALLGVTEPLVLSIILPTQRKDPALRKKFPVILQNSVKEALDKAAVIADESVRNQAAQQAEAFLKEFPLTSLPLGLAVYITPTRWLAFRLPFEPQPEVIADTTYEVRDLLYVINRMQPYWVVEISPKATPLFTGVGDEITPLDDPQLAEPLVVIDREFGSVGDRAPDPSVLAERKYINALARRLKYLVHTYWLPAGNLPIIVLVNDKERGFVERILEHEPVPGHNFLYITGDYADPADQQLREQYRQLVAQWVEQERQRQKERIETYYGMGRVAPGIEQAWKAAHMAAVETLLVQHNTRQEAWTHQNDPFQIVFQQPENPDQWHYHPDIIDDLIEEVVKYKGQVFFLAEPPFQNEPVVALLRFQLPS